jgi:hypothetical protein
MDGISGIDVSTIFVTDCIPGRLQFDSGYLWIKSYIFDSVPKVEINGQKSDVFYFIKRYNLIGVSFSESMLESSRIGHESDKRITLDLMVNDIHSRWTVEPLTTIKRKCNEASFNGDPQNFHLIDSAATASPVSFVNAVSLLLFLFWY